MKIQIENGTLIAGDNTYPIPKQLNIFERNGQIYERIYKYEVPWAAFPDDIRSVLYHDLPADEQQWKRILPKGLTLKTNRQSNKKLLDDFLGTKNKFGTMPSKERDKFIDQVFDYKANGVWFMNCGFPTYITGDHYFELNWWEVDLLDGIGVKYYKDRDRRVWLHFKYVEENPNAFGQAYMKARRDGATSRAGCKGHITVTTKFAARSGYQAIDDDYAQKQFLTHYVSPWQRLPDFLQPNDDGQVRPKSSINFSKPSLRSTKKIDESEVYLDSHMDYRPTKEVAYDGEKLEFYHLDEAGKIERMNVNKCLRVVRKAMGSGKKVIGKAWVTTTVEEMAKGGAEFKTLWEEADPDKTDKNGQTINGLLRLFIPAYDGAEGFVDKFGYSIIDAPAPNTYDRDGDLITQGAKEYFQNTRDLLKDQGKDRELADEKRMNPFTEDDALRPSADSCLFNALYISDRKLELTGTENVRGNLVWQHGKDTRVIWKPDPNGRFEANYIPDDAETNKIKHINSTVSHDDYGQVQTTKHYEPLNKAKFVIGSDPIEFSETTDGRRSDAAAHCFWRYDINHPEISHNFCMQYKCRPEPISDYFEDMIKMCVFFGCEILVETQKAAGLLTHFIKRGYYHFLMLKPEATDKPQVRGSRGEKRTIGVAASKMMHDSIVLNLNEFVNAHCHKVTFQDLLQDWLDFNIENTQQYDLSMSSGYALIAATKKVKQKAEPLLLEKIFSPNRPITSKI